MKLKKKEKEKMGKEISKLYFFEEIKECKLINQLFNKLFINSSLHVYTRTNYKPFYLINNLIERKQFILYYREYIPFNTPSNNTISNNKNNLKSNFQEYYKVISYNNYKVLKQYLLELNILFDIRVKMGLLSIKKENLIEECPICMEEEISVVLPCYHSFCTKCYEVCDSFDSFILFIHFVYLFTLFIK